MNWIMTYLRPLKGRIAKGIYIKIIGTVAELLIPFLLSYILEYVIVSERVGRILFFGGLMVACAVVACIGNITANRMAAKTTMLFSTQMRRDLFSKTLQLSARSKAKPNCFLLALISSIPLCYFTHQNHLKLMLSWVNTFISF